MRIGIDANPMLANPGGVGRHTHHLVRALLDLHEEVELVCYLRPGGLRAGGDRVGWNEGSRLRWIEAGSVMMPWRGSLDALDVYHGTNFKMQTTGRYGAVMTVHDVWLDRHPEYSPKLFGQRPSFFRTRRRARRARKVITVSGFSAGEIQAIYNIAPERIVVIPNAVSSEFQELPDTAALEEFQRRVSLPTEKFILFVGGADPRKNHAVLLRAYASCPARLKQYSLVMVGHPVHRFGDIRRTARTLGVEDRVICPGILPASELRVLYGHAALFVFPSLYEGFGMPVLEAMACGAPVITSNSTALPEVAGDAAVLVNPDDPEALARAMLRVLEDSALRAGLIAKGRERVKRFTWQEAARRTLAVYRDVCRS
jgi:glycosyltransferase involved in cell wall biosynthesis